MSKLAKERAENVFTDFKAAYTTQQARIEANRCLFCSDAPCIQACPTSIDIPQFIRKIATGNTKGSARTIFERNILGMSCARTCPVEVLCVGRCVYDAMGVPPIQIGKLQRYATDAAFEQGWRFFAAGPDTGRSVGLVGAGPASLAAAHRLRRFGHACVIYDKRGVTGGLSTTGVAPYKMRADRSLEEAEWILAIGGIDVRTEVEVGVDRSWDELLQDHDALFVGLGLGPDQRLPIPGSELVGVWGAVETIERLKLGPLSLEGVTRAVVVGGGNTAVDAVRELRGLGVPEVIMLYRGTEAAMSGYAHEWRAAKDQGARALWQAQPVALEGDGRVQRIRYVRVDAAKQSIEGSEQQIDTDLVLLAIGQSTLESVMAGLSGVSVQGGRIVVDDRQSTTRRGVFAGGDCANGGKEVVNAAAEGKRAAEAIHTYLSHRDG